MAKIFTNSSFFENIERTNATANANSLSRINGANSKQAFPTVLADIEKENRKSIAKNTTVSSLDAFSVKQQLSPNSSLEENMSAMEKYDTMILGRPTNYRAYLNYTPPIEQITANVLSNLSGEIPKMDTKVDRNSSKSLLMPISKENQPPGDNNLAQTTEQVVKQAEGNKGYLEATVQKHSDKIREYLSSLVRNDLRKDVSDIYQNGRQNATTTGKKESDIKKIIKIAGQYHGLDPSLALAVAKTESSLRPNVVSNDGHESKGIFQLLDGTAANMIKRLKVQEEYKPFDPKMNSHLGVGYLRYLHDIFSENTKINDSMVTFRASSQDDLEKLALAAYNAGEGKVIKAQEKAKSQGEDPGNFEAVKKFLPEITRNYVVKVASYKKELTENSNT